MTSDDYEGLHRRYARILETGPIQHDTSSLMTRASDLDPRDLDRLRQRFRDLVNTVWNNSGTSMSVELLDDPGVRPFIDDHTTILDSSFSGIKMPDALRDDLHRSNFRFSGLKTFHELNEVRNLLFDDNGVIKPFQQFLDDARRVDQLYNVNYLRAEYSFIAASARSAAQWEDFQADGDRYNLQYRTAGDSRVRPEHAALDGVTLPPDDPFWDSYYPPNGWRCRCNVIQVLKHQYPLTDPDDAWQRGREALAGDKKGMFRFNPGKQRKSVPDYNPYTISNCRNCDIPDNSQSLARATPPANQLCQACRHLVACLDDKNGCTPDKEFGDRLLISKNADQTELNDNIRAAKAMLQSFPDMDITIRPHVLMHGVKNPEYMINGLIADRKGIVSENGVTSGFIKAIRQGCEIVIIDLDMNLSKHPLHDQILANKICNRYLDFEKKIIKACYVIYRGRAVEITSVKSKQEVRSILQKLRP